jgi:hypothetical protein
MEARERKTSRSRVRGVSKTAENPQQLFSSFLRGASCLKSPRYSFKKNEGALYRTAKLGLSMIKIFMSV